MKPELLFVISPPRAGSTLLQRLLGSHSQVMTHPEPHLITPMAHLGYHDTVDKAPFDHINAAEAMRLFVSNLPGQENDYLDALRAYADTLYGRMLATSGKRYFLDKTPAYGLVLDFLGKLYPEAKFVVLTRHPLAVFSSYAGSFFGGDWQTAHNFNPIVERYVPAMAKFIRDAKVPICHVNYETLVARPETELARMFDFLGLPNEPEAVNYGERFKGTRGPGDPISVDQHSRPVTTSVDQWAAEISGDGSKRALAEATIARLAPEDLQTWGYPLDTLWDPLHQLGGAQDSPRRKVSRLNSYTIKRKALLMLKKDIHQKRLGKAVKRVRYYCDVLLRD